MAGNYQQRLCTFSQDETHPGRRCDGQPGSQLPLDQAAADNTRRGSPSIVSRPIAQATQSIQQENNMTIIALILFQNLPYFIIFFNSNKGQVILMK